MMNTNPVHHNIFSDKFRISVVDLTQIERATEEDKQYDIDLWARVLTATTWEEIDMLAKDNEYLRETSNAMYELDKDRLIRQQCQAREDFLYWERIKANHTKQVEAELAAKMHVTDKAVSKWERGLSRPDIDSIPRLAECLSMSTEELFGNTAKKSTPEKSEDILSLILTGIPLAMGISVAVLNLLYQIEARDSFILIGIGLASLALHSFLKNKNK